MLSSASSSRSGLASALFIAVSRRCSHGEKIDGRDMEVWGVFWWSRTLWCARTADRSNDSKLLALFFGCGITEARILLAHACIELFRFRRGVLRGLCTLNPRA